MYRLQDGRINGYRIVNSKFKAYACLYDDLDCKDDDLVSCLQEGRYDVVREENNDENVEVNSNKYIVALVTVKKRNSSSNAVPLNDMSYYINHYDVYLDRYNMCYGNYDDGETVFSLNDSNESRYIVYLENVDSIEDKGMYYGLFQDSNATEIEILSCGDDIIDMQFMFSNCNNLTKLDVSKLNTCHVTDMGYMFSFCYRLQVLDLSNFDITNVKNVSYMFSCCISLTSLIFPNCDKNTIANMSNMFACM